MNETKQQKKERQREDYFRAGLPVCTIERHIEEMGRKFQDGSHIIYGRGNCKGDSGKFNENAGRPDMDFAVIRQVLFQDKWKNTAISGWRNRKIRILKEE